MQHQATNYHIRKVSLNENHLFISVNIDEDGNCSPYTVPQLEGTCDITTPRLDLRKFRERDAQAIYEMSKDELVLAYFNGNPLDNMDEARDVIASWRTQYENDDFLVWCVQEADTKKAVGKISANVDVAVSCAEVEYSVVPSCRGKGYAAEALEHVVGYLHEIGVHRVQVKVNTRNVSSTRVAEKAGMELEGICRGALVDRAGLFYDVAIFAHVCGNDSTDLEASFRV